MLDLRIFRNRTVALGVGMGWILYLGISSAHFIMPFYLQQILGYAPKEVGLILVLVSVATIWVGPVSGSLSDRFGPRTFKVIGLILSALSAFILAFKLTPSSPLRFVVTILSLQRTGFSMFTPSNQSSVLNAVEEHQSGVTSGLLQLLRTFVEVTSVALTTAIVVSAMMLKGVQPSLQAVSTEVGVEIANAFVQGVNTAFLVSGCLLIVGVVLSLVKDNRASAHSTIR